MSRGPTSQAASARRLRCAEPTEADVAGLARAARAAAAVVTTLRAVAVGDAERGVFSDNDVECRRILPNTEVTRGVRFWFAGVLTHVSARRVDAEQRPEPVVVAAHEGERDDREGEQKRAPHEAAGDEGGRPIR